MTQKCLNKLKPKGWCNKPKTLQFQTILKRKIGVNYYIRHFIDLRTKLNSTHSKKLSICIVII